MTPIGTVRELIPTYRSIDAGDIGQLPSKPAQITSSRELAVLIRPIIGDAIDECVWCVYVDGANQLIAVYKISEGGSTESLVPTAKIFRGAVLCNAAAFVIIHNHLSGRAYPSAADRAVTEKLVQAGDLMGIPCLDHVVLGKTEHWSFTDHGLIEEYRKLHEAK